MAEQRQTRAKHVNASKKKGAKVALAVALCASTDKTLDKIAHEVGVSKRTLARWKGMPSFQARVDKQRQELANIEAKAVANLRKAELTIGIADRVKRVQALHDRWERLRAGLECILTERAADMAGVPGGASGLLAREYRRMGSGQGAPIVEQYRVDPGVLKLIEELREHEKQAAQELGQWVPDLPPERPGEDGYRLDELMVILRRVRARRDGGADGGDLGRTVDVSPTE